MLFLTNLMRYFYYTDLVQEVKNIYEIYLDSFFLLNFIYFYCMLYAGAAILQCPVTHFRILKGAFFGTVLYCFVILFLNVGIVLKVVIGYFVISAGMFFYTYRIRSYIGLLQVFIISLGMLLLTGGSVSLLSKCFRQNL